jgi:hypothetical protein
MKDVRDSLGVVDPWSSFTNQAINVNSVCSWHLETKFLTDKDCQKFMNYDTVWEYSGPSLIIS